MKKSKAKPNKATFNFKDNKIIPFKHGLHLDLSFKTIDRRSRLGKAALALYSYLREYVGNSSVVTELLVSRIVYKSIKLHLYESTTFAEPLPDLTQFYLSMSNSLRKDLATLQQLSKQSALPQDLQSYLKEAYPNGE